MRRGLLTLIVTALAALVIGCAQTPAGPGEDRPESVKGAYDDAYDDDKDKARADYAAAKDACAQQDEEPKDVCEEKAQADYEAKLTVARSRYDADKRKARD